MPTYNWIPDPVLSHWWYCDVQIAGEGRRVSLVRYVEQPEYWQLFRGDGNAGLIIGPTDAAGARDSAECWLFERGAIPA